MAQITKAEAGYLERSPDQRQPCVVCATFDPHLLSCFVVAGRITPMGTCDHYAAPERVHFSEAE